MKAMVDFFTTPGEPGDDEEASESGSATVDAETGEVEMEVN